MGIDNTSIVKFKQFFKEKETPRVEKFPEIDPDEEARKKKELKDIHGLVFEEKAQVEMGLLTKTLAASSIKEIQMPIINRIQLMKTKGITKVHFIIQSKTFGEIEVHLSMYDTAPYCFHLQMYGSDKIANITMEHQKALQEGIKTNVPKITLHIAPPLLRRKDRFATAKKKKELVESKAPLYSRVNKGKSS